MKILLVGDVVGSPGRDAVKALVPILRARHKLDFILVNCENIAGGAGVTPKTAQDLLDTPGIDALDDPFRVGMELIEKMRKETPVILVDMHAEATSEKIVMGWYLDGHVSAVVGTHTHIQTADERILPKGTAYLTDLGMTGPYDSVIGRKVEQILERFLTGIPQRFEVPETNVILCGAVIEVDPKTGQAERIERVQERLLPI